ncbi:MAG: PLP-dependent aminotransferase family protein [Clostridia bacterium]|nr:PLP-dependent aminotransferase family protein [Clostridia bacterium]
MEYSFSKKVSSLQPSAIREILKFTSMPGVISFAAGNPAPEAFPEKEVAQISANILATRPIDALQYSITEGYIPLRETVAQYMKTKHNVGKDFDKIIITAGAQQVMDLTTKALCNEGDTVICESPSFIGSLNAFRSYGVHLCGVPVESDGMNIEKLEQALKTEKNVRFIYTIPNFQNPSGVTMSLEKRKSVYELAKKYGVMILEDNPYGEIRFAGENVPCIKSLDTEGIVIYAGSFSKVLSPGMRVGYAIAPEAVIAKLTVCKQVSDVHTTIFTQIIADEFMRNYDFEAHLERIRAIYKHKAQLMMKLMDEKFGDKVKYQPIEGGLFLWCTLPDGVDMPAFCKKAVENKVAVVPGNAFLMDEAESCQNFRTNFSTPTDEQLIKGMDILGELVKSL